MAFGPKKDGSPNADFFQATETLQQFDAVRVWLQKNCKKVGIYIRLPPSCLCDGYFSCPD